MRFGTAIEVTTSQLRIELMFPADDDAEAWFRTRPPTAPERVQEAPPDWRSSDPVRHPACHRRQAGPIAVTPWHLRPSAPTTGETTAGITASLAGIPPCHHHRGASRSAHPVASLGV